MIILTFKLPGLPCLAELSVVDQLGIDETVLLLDLPAAGVLHVGSLRQVEQPVALGGLQGPEHFQLTRASNYNRVPGLFLTYKNISDIEWTEV